MKRVLLQVMNLNITNMSPDAAREEQIITKLKNLITIFRKQRAESEDYVKPTRYSTVVDTIARSKIKMSDVSESGLGLMGTFRNRVGVDVEQFPEDWQTEK